MVRPGKRSCWNSPTYASLPALYQVEPAQLFFPGTAEEMGQMPLCWSMILLVWNVFQASPDLCCLASGQKIWEALPEVNWMAWYQITLFIVGKRTFRHTFFFWAHFYVRALKWKAVLKAESRCDHGYVENTGISDQFTYWQAPQLLPIMNFLATLFFHSDLNPKKHMWLLCTYLKTASRSFLYSTIKALELCYVLDWLDWKFFCLFV